MWQKTLSIFSAWQRWATPSIWLLIGHNTLQHTCLNKKNTRLWHHRRTVRWHVSRSTRTDDGRKDMGNRTINDELKNVAQLVHSRHRSVFNFVMNVLSVLAAYSFFEKKPSINIDYCIENVDGQLAVIK